MKRPIAAIIMALATALFFSSKATAQSDWQTGTDSMLLYVNKSPITTGVLIDRSMPVSNVADFSNARDTSSYAYATQAYTELYGSSYSPARMTKPGKLFDMIAVQNIQNRIPVQVLDYRYNQINPTAIQDGLLTYDTATGFAYNTPGSPNPFIQKRLQISTLLAEKVESPVVTLVLMPHFISRNTGLDVQSVQINGSGINKILYGPVDTATVNFGNMGLHYLTVTTTLSNGQQFSTKNQIYIGEEPGSATNRPETDAPRACFDKAFEGNIPWQGYDETRAYRGKFDLSIYYRAGVPCTPGTQQSLKKPVILIDGFDATDKRTAKNRELYRKFLRYVDDVNFPPNPPVEIDFVDEIQRRGFDVILVDIPTYWHANTGEIVPLDSNASNPPPGYSWDMGKLIRGGGDFVERNAMTMVSLLIDLQQQMAAAGSTDSITLIGPSMGGQITRYALKYMEDRGIPHRVRLWISQDSNHEGAVLPIGEQFIIAFNAREQNAESIMARDRQLFAPAARQFLVNHFTRHIGNLADLDIVTEQAGGAPGFFERYYRAIDSIGWPQQCRKIATISGGENGNPLPVPVAWSPAMKIEIQLGNKNYFYSVLCDLFSSTNCRMATFTMYMSPPPGQRGLVAKARIPMKKRKDREFYIIAGNQNRSQSIEAVQSGFYWGYEELASRMDKSYVPFLQWTNNGNVIASTGHHIQITKTLYTGRHAHQPTGSTLAYGKGTNPNAYGGYHPKWDDNVLPYNLSCDGYIPFDAYMGPRTFSVLHDSIFYSQAQVLISEIRGIIPDYPKPDKTVFLRKSDPNKHYFCPGETLTFYLETNYGNVNALNPVWTVNSDKLQIVAGQGTPNVSIRYIGGLGLEEFQAMGGIKISVNAESPCYRLQPNEIIYMGAGDLWGGTVTSVSTGQGFNLQFGGGYNMSDRANVKILAGLSYKETNLQNYTLAQNTYGTAMIWSVTPVSIRGYIQNQLNITSDVMGEYVYKVNDANRCGTFINGFTINFSRQLLFRVSPNPAKDEVNISKVIPEGVKEVDKPLIVNISIHDLYSKRQLLTSRLPNMSNVFTVPVNQLNNGEYVIKIGYGGETYYEKLLIRR
jgi:pimeloyl-ACP methyl ester carboxylesterase